MRLVTHAPVMRPLARILTDPISDDCVQTFNWPVFFMLFVPAYSYKQYINQLLHFIKYIQKQALNSYMFRHRAAIFRELFRTKEYETQYRM
jgi:hypothetical protein